MTSGGGKTPNTSSISTRSEHEDIATQIESAKRNQKKLKSLALKRDGYRCRVSGRYDLKIAGKDLGINMGENDYFGTTE